MSFRNEKAKRWRPWQFSLRLLLLLMFGVATFRGGWAANDWNRKRGMKLAPPARPIVKNPSLLPFDIREMRRNFDTTLTNDFDIRDARPGYDTTLINDLPN